MFRWLNPTKHDRRTRARHVVNHMIARMRQPIFFTEGAVPDTYDGRFDLLLLLSYPIFSRTKDTAFGQALYDALFERLEYSLREQGAGDMGVPPRMRRMMQAFRGRMEAYENAAKDERDTAWASAIRRNVFGTVDLVPDTVLADWAAYARRNTAHLTALPDEKLEQADFDFVGWQA